MKNKKRIACLGLTALLAATTVVPAVGCAGRGGNRESVDKNKTQIYIGLGSNGVKNWADYAGDKFEEKYANVSFEEGKMGVQVIVSDYNEKFANFDTMPLNHSKYDEKLIITEVITYDKIQTMALDITDTVTSPIGLNPQTGTMVENGETESIQDKLLPIFSSYYGKGGETGDRYYALPAQETTFGFVYDIDLFDEMGFYFANEEAVAADENRTGDEGDEFHTYEFETTNAYTGQKKSYYFVDYSGEAWTTEDLSAGADGQKGTYDDGLPATYEEFFALCAFMVSEGVDPIRWGGNVPSYWTHMLNAMAADYEGDDFLLMSSYDGTATLVEFDANGDIVFEADGKTPKTYEEEITPETGYKLTGQAGFYHALKFLETLIDNTRFYNGNYCWTADETHKVAQRRFLKSRSMSSEKPIAMLLEGSWWQSEAAGVFEEMAAQDEKWSSENRRFGFMPLPKQNESLVGQGESTHIVAEFTTFITKSVSKDVENAYKLFLKEMYSDDGVYDFLKITGQMRPVQLNLSDSEYDALTAFGQSNYNRHNYTNVLFKPSYSSIYLANNSIISSTANFHWDTSSSNVPATSLRSESAESYFEANQKHWTKSRWDNMFKGKAY